MLDFHKNHKLLVGTALFGFLMLSTFVALVPAFQIQQTQPLPSMETFSEEELKGLHIYVQENCMSCHTQQVRNIEMDNTWGNRPSIPSDYYYSKQRQDVWRQSPSLLGSERTGPDLTEVGQRQPGMEWHLLHLYNPRIVVKESIMPSYPWLFEVKEKSKVKNTDHLVPVPEEFLHSSGKQVVASQEALYLVAYLQSLKQAEMPQNPAVSFIPSSKEKEPVDNSVGELLPDGQNLYMNNCAACHQADGSGLSGAFPPLAGSPIVNDENPETLIRIIMEGYDARAEYGVMAGFESTLSDEEIAAIVNHERSNWGNSANAVTVDEVKEIRTFVNSQK
ncbi:cbb3-type cytochrome c oxidase subunit II [Cyclobacterium plantarum]|uniref:Cytochrome c n=1 Tax=Cyclobacterium plantarum TaxID=2716263 RepID=A0ABX0H4S1_9BACT|nr:cbb3-type cytochrome c oxidase subunit II [Cyclobacterium plantarum]NHE56502.1 cytochrome c [Cyclobacterium plantarum]